MTRIHSRLEENRAQELDELLTQLKPLILDHIARSTEPGASIGSRTTPQELIQSVPLETPLVGYGTKGVYRVFEQILHHSVVTWHPGFLDKLYASTNPIGVISDLLLSLLNTNSHVFTVSPLLTLIEKKVGKSYAGLFGFNGEFAGGMTFPGGSWSNITSLHMARSILYPDTKTHGNGDNKFVIFTSEHSHYSLEKAAILAGLGSQSVVKVKISSDGSMDPHDLENQIIKAKEEGCTPLYVNATAGTTVLGSFDPLLKISVIAKKYNIWFHIDGSWGGNVIFSDKYKNKMHGSHLADSLTVNPHKLLGVPATCSFLLVPDERVFQTANSLNAPYLFHNRHSEETFYDLADGTMGCGRRPDALKLYMGWLYYGAKGYEERINHAYEIAGYFASKVASNPQKFKLVSSNPPPALQVCFFFNKDGKFDDSEVNTYTTREVVSKLHESGRFLIDYSPASGIPGGEFFRVVFISPVVDSELVDELYDSMLRLGDSP
jgi:glutamate decarboxylase